MSLCDLAADPDAQHVLGGAAACTTRQYSIKTQAYAVALEAMEQVCFTIQVPKQRLKQQSLPDDTPAATEPWQCVNHEWQCDAVVPCMFLADKDKV